MRSTDGALPTTIRCFDRVPEMGRLPQHDSRQRRRKLPSCPALHSDRGGGRGDAGQAAVGRPCRPSTDRSSAVRRSSARGMSILTGRIMYLHIQQLINEIAVDEPDPAAANALQEGLGGQFGEMRTMMQYLFQSMNFRGDAASQAVQGPAPGRRHRGDQPRRADRHHDRPAARRLAASTRARRPTRSTSPAPRARRR